MIDEEIKTCKFRVVATVEYELTRECDSDTTPESIKERIVSEPWEYLHHEVQTSQDFDVYILGEDGS